MGPCGGRCWGSTIRWLLRAPSNRIDGCWVDTCGKRVELMAPADRGLAHLATREFKLKDANQALLGLHHGGIKGAAVLVC